MKRTLLLSLAFFVLILSGCRSISVQAVDTVQEESSLVQEENSYQKIIEHTVDQNMNSISIQPKHLLIYYAADWCPYCVDFAPQLKQTYSQLKRMYGDSIELVFAGHINDQGNENLLSFLEQDKYPFYYIPFEAREASGVMALLGEHRFYIPGFILLDNKGVILSSSNKETRDDYVRDRPLYHLQSLLIQDCAFCQQ